MTVRLIDFGVARPMVDRVGSFKSELNTALATLGRKIMGDFQEIREVNSLIFQDGVFRIPDNDRIIAFIEQARGGL